MKLHINLLLYVFDSNVECCMSCIVASVYVCMWVPECHVHSTGYMMCEQDDLLTVAFQDNKFLIKCTRYGTSFAHMYNNVLFSVFCSGTLTSVSLFLFFVVLFVEDC